MVHEPSEEVSDTEGQQTPDTLTELELVHAHQEEGERVDTRGWEKGVLEVL